MTRPMIRAATALVLLAGGAAYGVGGLGSPAGAAPVVPSGGCWSYTPSATALDAPPALDRSTALEDWVTEPDGGVGLTTSGATAVGGSRTVTLTIDGGPVVSALTDASGTASVLLSVDGTPLAAPVSVPFDVEAGQPVDGLVATATVPLAAAGEHRVRLDALYLDVPSQALRLACNGQAEDSLSPGTNPATDPEPTDLASAFTTVAAAASTVTAIADQSVLTAARPADVVSLGLVGFASSAPVSIALCNAAGACSPVAGVVVGPDGAATTSFMVPGSAPVGAGSLRVSDGTTTLTSPFAVLGVQTVAAAETLQVESTTVALTGTGWDPGRPVTIRGYAGAGSSTAVTADPVVVAEVDAAGTFAATYDVADTATQSVVVDQARGSSHIGAVYLVSGVIGGAADPDDGTTDPDDEGTTDPDDEGGGSDEGDAGGATTDPDAGTSGGTVTTPIDPGTPVADPGDIPIPGDLPVEDPVAEDPAEESEPVADLAVSEVRLDGESSFSELFGGAPRRDLVFLVENVGTATVEDPLVRVSVGRSEDVEPEVVAAEVRTLDPGEQTVVTVPLELPMAAFGGYVVVGQVGDTETGAFEVGWTTYPWGLFALNALALLLLALGVRHRLGLRRTARVAAVDLPDGAAVVDLPAADAWWAYRRGAGPRPLAPRPVLPALPPVADEPAEGEAVVDLAAAQAWWDRRDGGVEAS